MHCPSFLQVPLFWGFLFLTLSSGFRFQMEPRWSDKHVCEQVGFSAGGFPVVGHFFRGPSVCISRPSVPGVTISERNAGGLGTVTPAVSGGRREVGVAGALSCQDGGAGHPAVLQIDFLPSPCPAPRALGRSPLLRPLLPLVALWMVPLHFPADPLVGVERVPPRVHHTDGSEVDS